MKNFFFVGVAGDWHGDTYFAHQALAAFAQAGVTEVLQLGDFGLWPGKSGAKYLYKLNKYLTDYGQTLYVTLGNHEDYTQVHEMIPVPRVEGFVYNPLYPNIYFAERGARWVWNGVSFVSLGGANSIDFTGRVEWVSWWREEQITLGDVYRTVEGGHAQVMLAHDCPAGVNLFGTHRSENAGWSPTQLRYAQESRMMMRVAVDSVKPDMFFHGHYHHYLDVVSELNDGLDDYSFHSIGLDMNGNYTHSSGILWLSEDEGATFELMKIPRNILQSE